MLTISLVFVIIGGVFLAERLRAIQKHSKSRLAFIQYQREVMTLLRDENLQLSSSEYKKVRKILSANSSLLEIYSCQRPSVFHTRFLFGFLNGIFAKKAYEYDKIVHSLKPKDERVIALQVKLNKLITWTVFYNTPKYILGLFVVMLAPVVLSVIAIKSTKDFRRWYRDIIRTYSKENLHNKWGSLTLHP